MGRNLVVFSFVSQNQSTPKAKQAQKISCNFGFHQGNQWKPEGQGDCLPSVLKMQSHAIYRKKKDDIAL